MRPRAPISPLAPSRLARLIRWAMLTLLWLAAHLDRIGAVTPALVCADRIVRQLILARAAQLLPAPRKRGAQRPNANRHQRASSGGAARVLIGGRLRQRLRRGSPGQRLSALGRALQNIDVHARALLKRLRAGLTRRRPLLAHAAPEQQSTTIVQAPACAADTS